LNVNREIAFAGGLHAGEMAVLVQELGEPFFDALGPVPPMLAVEYVATKLDEQLNYYRDLQEIVWAMLEEGFSHRVIEPGITTTVVGMFCSNVPGKPTRVI
jgi:hypothetical protein